MNSEIYIGPAYSMSDDSVSASSESSPSINGSILNALTAGDAYRLKCAKKMREKLAARRRKKREIRRKDKPYKREVRSATDLLKTAVLDSRITSSLAYAHLHHYQSMYEKVRSEDHSCAQDAEDCRGRVAVNLGCSGFLPSGTLSKKMTWGTVQLDLAHSCGVITSDDIYSLCENISTALGPCATAHPRLAELLYHSPPNKNVLFSLNVQDRGKLTGRVELVPGPFSDEALLSDEDSLDVYDKFAARSEALFAKVNACLERKKVNFPHWLEEKYRNVMGGYCDHVARAGQFGVQTGADVFEDVEVVPISKNSDKTLALCINSPAVVDMVKIAQEVWTEEHFWLCTRTNRLCVVLGELPNEEDV